MLNKKLKTFDDLVKVAEDIKLTIVAKEKILAGLKGRLQENRKDKTLLHKIEALEDEVEALKAIYEGLEDSIKKKETNMLRDPVKKARDKYNKAAQQVKQFRLKIAELEEKIKSIEAQNKSLREEAGAILAKINLGELPAEARAEVDEKMAAIEQNKLEIEGLKFAIKELEKRLEEKKQKLNELKIAVYEALRNKLIDLVKKEFDRYLKLARETKEAHTKFTYALDWLNRTEFYMQKEGYNGPKLKEELGDFFDHLGMLKLPGCKIDIPDESPGKYCRCHTDLTDFWEKVGLSPVEFSGNDAAIERAIYETLGLEVVE